MINIPKLIKLMAMTTSDRDGEALNAVRLANRMLAHEHLTWEDVFKRFAEKAPKPAPKPRVKTASVGIEEMLVLCKAKVRGDPREFIESLDAFFSDNGYLTRKQEGALKKFYENAVRSRK